MLKKNLLLMTVVLMAGSSAAYATDYFNSYGAARGQVIKQNTSGLFTQEDSCDMAAQGAEAVAIGYFDGAPESPLLEEDALEEAIREAEEQYSIMAPLDMIAAKVHAYDLDEYSSPEEFGKQYYQDCLSEQ